MTVLVRQFEGAAFVGVKDAARLLGISERHFRGLVAAGKLPTPARFGRATRWSVAKLLDAGERLAR